LGFGLYGRAFERQIPRRKIVDLVVGPDAYKDLPNLLAEVEEGRDANVILSKDETYGDISVRLMMAFAFPSRAVVTICVLLCGPFTRGRERSREPRAS
jgi:tRNA-2-methylthio-N6-dimethylallyladenosine synthase